MMYKKIVIPTLSVSILLSSQAFALPLRSFVAVPIAKDSAVIRANNVYNEDTDVNMIAFNVAYGVGRDDTFFVTVPYFTKSDVPPKVGEIDFKWRHMMYQDDRELGTWRVGLVGGGKVSVNRRGDGGIQFGAVSTYFHDRSQVDSDIIYKIGNSESPNTLFYDASWQYRVTPAEYPEWGLSQSVNTVLEYNGRYTEGSPVIHQMTVGLQWVQPQWVLEGGVYKELNRRYHLGYVLSLRHRF